MTGKIVMLIARRTQGIPQCNRKMISTRSQQKIGILFASELNLISRRLTFNQTQL